MGYEIDFLGVGEESKSGDAIAIRFGHLHGPRLEQTVIIIDGGFSSTGEALVNHVRKHYNTNVVDLVISTHPDQDHIGGLPVVLEELEVQELWLHQPWQHNQGLADKFVHGRITDESIGERLKKNLERAWRLAEQARQAGILVREPFTNCLDTTGNVRVLGPSQQYYEELIPYFDAMPEIKEDSATNASIFDTAIAALKRFFVSWGEDKIDDNGKTSPKNNSSVITQLIVDGRRLIFTGDAGIQALEFAADELDACMNPAKLDFFQIPHHGSRRNIGPKVLNRLIGPPVMEGVKTGVTSIASTAKQGEPKHPRKAVMNAFTHRGALTLATRGKGVCHSHEAPKRDGWEPLTPEPYHYEYEDEEART